MAYYTILVSYTPMIMPKIVASSDEQKHEQVGLELVVELPQRTFHVVLYCVDRDA